MKVILTAFGYLKGTFSVGSLRDEIKLIHRSNYVDITETELTFPTNPTYQMAIFEFRGNYLKNKPIYEFKELR